MTGIERMYAYTVDVFPALVSVVDIQRRVQVGAGKIYAIVAHIDFGDFFRIAGFSVGTCDFVYSAVQGRSCEQILDQMIASGECQPCILYLVDDDSLVSNDAITLNADNFATWSEARKALVEMLKKM